MPSQVSKNILIARALAEFQSFLVSEMGEPVSLKTLGAFSVMVKKITDAVLED